MSAHIMHFYRRHCTVAQLMRIILLARISLILKNRFIRAKVSTNESSLQCCKISIEFVRTFRTIRFTEETYFASTKIINA